MREADSKALWINRVEQNDIELALEKRVTHLKRELKRATSPAARNECEEAIARCNAMIRAIWEMA